jgi:hypothetical protein
VRKLALGFVLASAAFGFLISPAMAADPPQAARVLTAADRAFIASIAAPNPSTAPVPAARRPPGGGVGQLSLCTATANCASGTVSCEDNTDPASCTGVDRNCSAGEPGHVTCDGVTTWCPTACPCTCAQLQAACAAECYPCPYTFNCTNPEDCDYFCHCRFSGCF